MEVDKNISAINISQEMSSEVHWVCYHATVYMKWWTLGWREFQISQAYTDSQWVNKRKMNFLLLQWSTAGRKWVGDLSATLPSDLNFLHLSPS